MSDGEWDRVHFCKPQLPLHVAVDGGPADERLASCTIVLKRHPWFAQNGLCVMNCYRRLEEELLDTGGGRGKEMRQERDVSYRVMCAR